MTNEQILKIEGWQAQEDIIEAINDAIERAKAHYGKGEAINIDGQDFYRFSENEGRDVDYMMRYERKFLEYLTKFL